MGWYHGKQMLDGSCPSAKLTTVVEPYFLGDGADSPPGKAFKAWADEMSAKHGTKFVKSISDVEIKVRLSAWLRYCRLPPELTLRTPTCSGRAPPSLLSPGARPTTRGCSRRCRLPSPSGAATPPHRHATTPPRRHAAATSAAPHSAALLHRR